MSERGTGLLVFGKVGQLAIELQARAPAAVYLGVSDADLSDPAACVAAIEAHAPSAVINAAAYTAVDKAEEDRALAMTINAEAPAAMARACAARDIPFVQVSTDYVFDGSGNTPWPPDATPAPLGVYGASKAACEAAVAEAGGRYGILRTSWVFSAHGANFLKTMLRLSETRDHLTIVADQVGGPTPAGALAEACLAAVEGLRKNNEKSGTYNFSGAPDVSWADFARGIFAAAGRSVTVEDIPSSSYPTPAERPKNSRLDCTSFTETFGMDRPDWRSATQEIVDQLT